MTKMRCGIFLCAYMLIFPSCRHFLPKEVHEYTLNGVHFTIEGAPCTFFAYYDDFVEHKAAWTEPASYSFVYTWSWGDSFVSWPLKVTVLNGEPLYEVAGYTTEASEERSAQEKAHIIEEYRSQNALFPTISALYDYIDDYYKTVLAQTAGKQMYSLFVATYKTGEACGVYPTQFCEFQTDPSQKSDSCGYGGVNISVRDVLVP